MCVCGLASEATLILHPRGGMPTGPSRGVATLVRYMSMVANLLTMCLCIIAANLFFPFLQSAGLHVCCLETFNSVLFVVLIMLHQTVT